MIKFVNKNKLNHFVEILLSVESSKVGNIMRNHDILLVTSNQKEGWGAVVNEGMNNGCVVVCSDKVGSARYLIKNQQNGIIYKNNKINDLYNKVIFVKNNPKLAYSIRRSAQKEIIKVWNYKIAVSRFVLFLKSKIEGKETIFRDGPLSID